MIKPPTMCLKVQFNNCSKIFALSLEMREYVFSIYPLFKSRVRAMSALKLLSGYSIKPVWMISNLELVYEETCGCLW